MAANRIFNYFGRFFAVWMAVTGLMASEHRGIVKAGPMPVPGVTVVATMGEKKVTTTTDDAGAYTFPNLEDGVWTVHVSMLGFGTLTQEIAITPGSPNAEWDLKLLSADQIKAAVEAALNPTATPTPAAAPAATPATTTAATPTEAPKPAATPATPAAAPAATKPAATTAANGRSGRGSTNNGNPSLRQAVQGYQRMNVNATGDTGGADAGASDIGASSDMSGAQSGDAYVVGGTISSGVDMPQQNDWGMGGRGGDMMGGPGGMMGGGIGGDQGGMAQVGGGRGGRGGDGGGPGGMMGGGMGGFAPGGPGGRGGGPGGRGGQAGGRGGRAGQNSFGNGRRGQQARYNASLEFRLDNSALDAQNYSQTGVNTGKPAYAKSNLTASLGGPFKIPHLIKTDKINFNLNYSLRRNRNANSNAYTLPTPAELGGDFSQAINTKTLVAPTIYDPTTGNPFPGNVIPSSRISPQAKLLAIYFPTPNILNSTSRYNYQTNLVSLSNQDNINLRMNGSLNTKNQFNGNFSWQRADGTSASIWGLPGQPWDGSSHQNAVNSGLGWTYHVTTRLFNRANITFSRNVSNSYPYWANRINLSQQLGVTGNDQSPSFWGPPSLSFIGSSSIAGLSDSSTTIGRAQTAAFTDSVVWIHKSHNFTFGTDLRRQHTDPISQNNARGNFSFNGTNTAGPYGTATGLYGFDFADFLLGLPDTSSIAYGNADKYFRNSWGDVYVDDDWRLSPKLTLRLGLRWDYQAPVYELYGRLVNIAVGQNFTSGTAVCASSANIISGATCASASSTGLGGPLVNPSHRELQPRVGFAWRPFTKGSMVVRGGIGIYYNTSVYQSIAQSMAQQYPFSQTLNDSATTVPLTMANGFIRTSTATLPSFGIAPNFQIGSLNVWQLAVQQNLKGNFVATVTYNGDQAIHQPQTFIPNTYPQGTFAKGVTAPCPVTGVANPCPSNFIYEVSGGNSNLQQLSGQIQRRFRSGISGSTIYTFTRSIDDASAGGRGGASSIAQNWMDLDAERANSSLARRHSLNFNLQYSTGMGTRGGTLVNGWKGQLIKNWTITTNGGVSSGAFETPSCSACISSGTGISGNYRATYTGQPLYINGSLNSAAFTNPAAGQYGNAGRNIITGPATFNLGAQMGRIFRIGERRSVDLRFDANNILNHVSYSSYNTTVGSVQFGVLQSPSSMRVFSAVLRFRF